MKQYNTEKEHTMSVRSSNNENSTYPNSQMKLQSRLINDFPATVKPPPAVYNTSSYIPKFTAQVVSSLMDDTFKLNYEEFKRDEPMPFTLPPQWERPVDYQTMAGDGTVHIVARKTFLYLIQKVSALRMLAWKKLGLYMQNTFPAQRIRRYVWAFQEVYIANCKSLLTCYTKRNYRFCAMAIYQIFKPMTLYTFQIFLNSCIVYIAS